MTQFILGLIITFFAVGNIETAETNSALGLAFGIAVIGLFNMYLATKRFN
jgi:hypothetical protein